MSKAFASLPFTSSISIAGGSNSTAATTAVATAKELEPHRELKGLAFQDTQAGPPPVLDPPLDPRGWKAGVQDHRRPAPQQRRSGLFSGNNNSSNRRSLLSEDARRDSGMAPSTSTAASERPSTPERGSSGAVTMGSSSATAAPAMTATTATSASIPSIVVEDEAKGPAETPTKMLRIPPAENTSVDGAGTERDGVLESLPQTQQTQTGDDGFEKITMDIPTGELDDPFTSKLQFSNRGSMLWAGEEANGVLRGSPGGRGVRNARHGREELRQERAVSAEERGFSKRLRFLYEHGEETLLDQKAGGGEDHADDTEEIQTVRPTSEGNHVKEVRSSSALSMRSTASMDPNEVAGGLEDWTDVNSGDVDRYGFIKAAKSPTSKRTSVMSTTGGGIRPGTPGDAAHSTALSVVDETSPPTSPVLRSPSQPKQNRFSTAAGGKSVRPSPSILSSRSKRSTTANSSFKMPFRSDPRSSRLFKNADLMLAPPTPDPNEQPQSPSRPNDIPPPNVDRALERKRAAKWEKMAKPTSTAASSKGAGTTFTFNTRDPKLVSRVWKGIPDRWRAPAWHAFLSASAARRAPQPSDAELEAFFHACQDDDCADDVQIDMDVPRTVGEHVMFRKRYRGGQRLLFRVLRALSLYFPATGYVQGMASVAATLLCYYAEETAFVMAARLWALRGVGYLYQEGFGGLAAALADLERHWLRGSPVARRLDDLGIAAMGWGPKWYLTLFNYVLPFDAQLRVWDVLMLIGDPPDPSIPRQPVVDKEHGEKPNLSVLHATAAALLRALGDGIVAADFEGAMGVLTAAVPVARADLLMRVAQREWDAHAGKGAPASR